MSEDFVVMSLAVGLSLSLLSLSLSSLSSLSLSSLSVSLPPSLPDSDPPPHPRSYRAKSRRPKKTDRGPGVADSPVPVPAAASLAGPPMTPRVSFPLPPAAGFPAVPPQRECYRRREGRAGGERRRAVGRAGIPRNRTSRD